MSYDSVQAVIQICYVLQLGYTLYAIIPVQISTLLVWMTRLFKTQVKEVWFSTESLTWIFFIQFYGD